MCSSPLSVNRFLLICLLCAGSALASAQVGLRLPNWVKKEIIQKISISGYRRLRFGEHKVTGDTEAFGYGNYGGQGQKKFTDFGSVQVRGYQVFGALNFDFNIQDSRFQDPQSQRFTVDYSTGPWDIDLGDIRASMLNTNRFALVNKSLKGASLAYTGGPLRAKAIFSDVKGAPRTVTLNGSNSAGPYYLQSSQIVRGSETIEVDGVRQILGQDYTINYEIGSITFVNRRTLEAKIISPASTIAATYEVFGFSGSRGRVEGGALAYNFGKLGAVGFTAMRQVVGGSGSLSSRLEKFQGFGPPSTPYFLQFEPLDSEPIAIRVDGILQTEGIDYFFDLENTSIFFFNRFMPATSNIDVLYTPKPTRTVEGNREVVGWDYRIPLGKGLQGGSFSYYQATGKLTNTPTPSQGTARGFDMRYTSGPATYFVGARDIPAGYVNIESVGFNRNERAIDLRVDVQASPRFFYGLSHRNASISSRHIDGSGVTTFVGSRFTTLAGNMSIVPSATGNSLPWTLGYSRTRSRNPSGETNIDTTDVSTSKSGKNWNSSLSLQHQDAVGPVSGSNTKSSVSLNSIALKTGYRPSDFLTLNLNTSLSQVRSEGEEGLGKDIQASANWKPSDKFDLGLIIQDSDAGQIATLGQFSSGYGSGYGGSGFSSGAQSSGFTSASKVRSYILRSNYDPTENMFLTGRAYIRETSGSFSSNTKTTGFNFSADWLMSPTTSLQTSIDTSRTTFLNSPLSSANTVLSAFLDGAPRGPWSWHVGFSTLLSGGTSQFSQDSTSFDTSVGHRLTDRQSLNLSIYQTSSTGSFAQQDSDISVGYRYQIWRSMALQLAYRTRDVENRDPLLSSGAYTSRGFDIELVFNFGS